MQRTSDIVERLPPDGELLTGRVVEYGELLDSLAERPGLLVLTADPWSGTSALLRSGLDQLNEAAMIVDARRCRDALDLAIAIADRSIGALASDAEAWWTGSGPPSDAAALRLSRALGANRLDVEDLRTGAGEGTRRLRESIALLAVLSPDALLAIDHLGPLLSALSVQHRLELLGTLRASRQEHPGVDLVLVEYPEGPVSAALGDERHPLYRAGARLRIRRASPLRFVSDLAITRPWTDVPVDLIGAAAELAGGVPALAWAIMSLAPTGGDSQPARALEGWLRLRRLTAPTTAHQWELLRRVHPLAQPITAAMSVGVRPHAIGANSKSVNEGLKRMRELGLAWRAEARSWTLADPLLAAWVRDHPPPWARRRSHREPMFSGFAPLREDDDVVPVSRVRSID